MEIIISGGCPADCPRVNIDRNYTLLELAPLHLPFHVTPSDFATFSQAVIKSQTSQDAILLIHIISLYEYESLSLFGALYIGASSFN